MQISIDSAIPSSKRTEFVRFLLSRMSHVTTSTPCASASFRNFATSASAMHFDSNASNAAKFGAFPLTTHRGSLSQLIPDGHVHPRRRAIRRDDSANHRRLG